MTLGVLTRGAERAVGSCGRRIEAAAHSAQIVLGSGLCVARLWRSGVATKAADGLTPPGMSLWPWRAAFASGPPTRPPPLERAPAGRSGLGAGIGAKTLALHTPLALIGRRGAPQ